VTHVFIVDNSDKTDPNEYFTDKQKLRSFVISREKVLYYALRQLNLPLLNKSAHFYFACQSDADQLLTLLNSENDLTKLEFAY